MTINAVTGYTGTVSLTCQQTSTTASGGDRTTCTGGGSTSAVTLTSSATSGSVTFTIGTSAKVTTSLARPKIPNKEHEWISTGSGIVMALLVFFGIPARRHSWRSMFGLFIVLAILGAVTSCGGGSVGGGTGSGDPGTTAGT